MPDESTTITTYLKNWLALQNPIPTAYQLAKQFSIKINLSDISPKRGNLLLRAEYSGNPPTITIYQKSIAAWSNQLNMENPILHPSLEELIEICIFHEFVHHLFLHPTEFFPIDYSNKIKKLKRTTEEEIVRIFVQDWLSRRFPEYNTQVEIILGK